MSDEAKTLEEQVANFRKCAAEYREKHGSVEARVGLNSPFHLHRITSIDGVPIEAEEGITLIDTSGDSRDRSNDIVVDGPLIYFHTEDHSMFGSKAVIEDDDDDWDWDD